MRLFARLALSLAACLVAVPAHAEGSAARFVSPAVAQAEMTAFASYGPFRVIDPGTAVLVDATDEHTPAYLEEMLSAWSQIATLRFIEAPGTYDDRANLKLGRMIRAAGLATEVPAEGSVRSGAVELVLAGTTRHIDDGAEFAVHSWKDEKGREAADFALDARENTRYLSYYRDMGLDDGVATSFYAMTNSVPFEDALWLTGAELRGWLGERSALPTLAYLDSGTALN